MKYYLVAGERSGDMHGARLISEIKKLDSEAQFRCMGGDMMVEEGAELTSHYSSISFMGFIEVITHLGAVSKMLKLIKSDIDQYKPDVVILIDFAGFNMRMAKYCKSKGLKVYYYISPKIWAWNTGRVKKIKAYVDRMFCILPFEKAFYQKHNYEADYVGNPIFDSISRFEPNQDFAKNNNLDPERKIIAVLPGSRKAEIEHMLIYMLSLLPSFPQYQFVVAAVNNLPREFYQNFENRPNIKIVYDQTYDLLTQSEAALVTSGTATLETALFKVPQVVCYKTSIISYWIGRMVIKVPFISLVNLIAQKKVVVELIQDAYNPRRLRKELERVLEGEGRQQVLEGYEDMRNNLANDSSASENTARLIVKYLKK